SPDFQNSNYFLDHITLWNGRLFPIYRNSCRIIPGRVPSVCPKARPSLPPEFLPMVSDLYRQLKFLGEGQTVHWVGDQSTIESVCTCKVVGSLSTDRQAVADGARLELDTHEVPIEASSGTPTPLRKAFNAVAGQEPNEDTDRREKANSGPPQ